jgi:predicted enzyme related to lactoylglutathione lyase
MIARLRLAVIASVLLVLACGASAAELAFPSIGTAGKYYPGKFIWFDLVTNDLSAARQFYGAVFGWQFRTIGPAPASYTLIEDQGHSVGGMFMRAPPPGAKASARWLALISVSDPAQAARYVEQHGGKVIVPPASLPGRGTHALFRDPQGAVFGVTPRSPTTISSGSICWRRIRRRPLSFTGAWLAMRSTSAKSDRA